MPPKAHVPAPIDRPLAKAYLREFSGWSTNYPPGLSDPTSLRVMENVWVDRAGSVRLRPGMRHLSYMPDRRPVPNRLIGSHEAFYLNNGHKAYLFAVKEADTTVGFRVLECDDTTGLDPLYIVRTLTDPTTNFTVGAGLNFTAATTYVRYLQIDNKIFALSDGGESARVFTVGTTKTAKKVNSITVPAFNVTDKLVVVHPDFGTEFPTPTSPVAAETKTAGTAGDKTSGTLISSTSADNVYNYGFFYTFTNELGESAPSQITAVKAKRRWSSWMWETANAAGEPTGTPTGDPDACADQLVAYMPGSVWNAAVLAGATAWNLYMLTWSDQDSVPPEGTLLQSKQITGASTWADTGWIRMTPANGDYNYSLPLPTAANRFNFSDPTKAGQGLVAADRMIMVYDPTNPAVIRWSSNQQGNYTDFSSSKGGGYKTLTSGNLFIPACVKLWQNPQSVDTLTVLCLGTDGYSTSYYMAPAEVTAQSDSTPVMGFEETTATPGTVSPFGVEVFNNALYHPLDDQLMKSTAANYNINHKSMTDDIRNQWVELDTMSKVVSSQLDGRLYYIVNNPRGEHLEDGCNGNEIWVLDVGGPAPVWSRWLIQAVSLRKIKVDGKLCMSVVRPDGIFYLDEFLPYDELVAYSPGSAIGFVGSKNIQFKLETNTQGANRAHDAWCRLQQANITLANFRGTLRWGIRGWDVNGRPIERAKQTNRYGTGGDEMDLPDDFEDFLKIGRDMKEWRFFAESVLVDERGIGPFTGGISYVQYRYAPISVNVGYEYGSVETFDYAKDIANDAQRTTDSGVPIPFIDTNTP